jgi:hypothetical protein
MDARARLAAQILEETRRAPSMQTCHAAAVLAGVSLVDADECDDGACCCPRCPWSRTASNWRPHGEGQSGPPTGAGEPMEINTGAAGRMQLGTPGVGMTPFDSMAVRPGLGEAGR